MNVAPGMTCDGVSWNVFALVITMIWTVVSAVASFAFWTLSRSIRDGFVKNDASHLRIYELIETHKQDDLERRLHQNGKCEERMNVHGGRLGDLEREIAAVKARAEGG